MALADIVLSGREITTPDKQTFMVYPLTLADIISLAASHPTEVDNLMEGKSTFNAILARAPLLVAQLIALACREPDQVATAQRLPAGVQLIAMQEIFDISMPEGDRVGKIVEAVALFLQKLQDSPEFAELIQNAKAKTESIGEQA